MNLFSSNQQQNVLNKLYIVTLNERIEKNEFEQKLNGLLGMIGDKLDYVYCQGVFEKHTLGMIYCGSNTEYKGAFTYSEISQNACIADAHYATTKVKTGDKIQIGDRIFEIRATDENMDNGSEFSSDFRIPYATAPDDTYIYAFRLILKDMPNEQLGDKITAYVNDVFSISEYVPAEIIDAEAQQRKQLSIAACFGISLIMVLCLCYVYTYFIRKRKKQIGILILCGCQPETANNIFTAEIIVYVIIGSLISLPVVRMLISLFNNIFPSFSDNYSLGIYAVIIAGYGIMTGLVLTLFLRSVVKDAVAEIQKGAL
ncbi:MAG: FtsX-like permease family protein [Oscillospiraceae bacterium]